MITEKDTIQDIDIIIDFADFGAEEKIKMIKKKLAQYWQQNPVDDGQEGKGLRWVKASERLPKEYKHVFLRLDKNAMRIGYHENGEWQNEDELFLNKENIEWLDESPALPVGDGEGEKRLISMVERRMKKAGIIDILIDRLPGKEYSQLIYNFFESLREIDEPIINGNP